MKNLITGILLLLVPLLVLVAWFMYGQGWDRTSAMIVIERSFLLLPVLAGALLFSAPFQKLSRRLYGEPGSWWMNYLRMLFVVIGTCALGFGLPYLIVFIWQQPPSPFEELWMMMGGVTVIMGSIIYWIVKPARYRHWFALSFLAAAAGILFGLRAFVFSFF